MKMSLEVEVTSGNVNNSDFVTVGESEGERGRERGRERVRNGKANSSQKKTSSTRQ